MKFFDMPDVVGTKSLNAFYKKLLNQVPDLIFKMVWKTSNLYAIVYCSENVNDIYELTVYEFKSNPLIALKERVLPDYRKNFVNTLQHSRKHLTPWDYEYQVDLPNKGLRWMKVAANPELQKDGTVTFFGRMSDITEKKEQELQLKISEERFKFALQAASEGIWDWDMITNRIYLSGQSMKIIERKEKDAIVDVNFWIDRMHPDDKQQFENNRKAHLEGKTSKYESIFRIKTDKGKYRWILSRGKIVQFDDNGNPMRCMGSHKDITHLKEKEIEMGNIINIIGSQNNRLSNFAHIVSHNLRSHAGNLKMLLDLFKNANEDEKDEMLKNLEAISDGLSITIAHLKDLVEIQFELKKERKYLNLRAYLKNILHILHNEITKNEVNIEINIPLDAKVYYNSAYLESVLLNFTTNAIKYSSSERKPVISYDFEVVDGKKVLKISDNGLGIDLKKHGNAMFGMYKTFHKHEDSRGIGLFITKNQVESMGGKIEVSSEVNKGTTFKIYFNEKNQ